MRQSVLILVLSLTVACCAAAANERQALEKDGVSIEVRRFDDRVSFCVRADQDHKVSSEFGVEFTLAKGSAAAWRDRLPKVITGPGYYFDLPARFDLRARPTAEQQDIRVELGACSHEAKTCDRIEFAIAVPSERDQAPFHCER